MRYGIDVSYVQGEQCFDFELAKAQGYDFCIVRVGVTYRGVPELDEYFVSNINAAKAAGMDIGIYYYSTALTEWQAQQEARWLLDAMHTYLDDVELAAGVWYDVETRAQQQLGAQELASVVMAFFNEVNAAGVYAGLYGYYDMLTNNLDVSMLPDYISLWPANYGEQNYYKTENPGSNCPIWQYSDSGNVGGVDVDLDVMY